MTADNNLIRLDEAFVAPSRIDCQHCFSRPWCFGGSLDSDELSDLEEQVIHFRPTQSKEFLGRAGDTLDGIYVVRSGSFKSYRLHENGNIHIKGFHLPGEIMGMGDTRTGIRSEFLEALETSSVCALSLAGMERLMVSNSKLMMKVLTKICAEAELEKDRMCLLWKQDVEQKLANFILSLIDRSFVSGFSNNTLHLSMKRVDIANHLGMAVESISRALLRFAQQGFLKTAYRDIEILDHSALVQVAGLSGSAAMYPENSLQSCEN